MTDTSKVNDSNGYSPQDSNGKKADKVRVKNKPIVDSTLASGDGVVPVKKYGILESPLDEEPVILERPSIWGHVFVWVIISMTVGGITWAALSKIDQSVPAVGKLEPSGAAKEVQPPAGGVVKEILVKAGQKVKKGELLITFDPTAPEADLESQKKLKDTLEKENKFYDVVLNGGTFSPELAKQLLSTSQGADLEKAIRFRDSLAQEIQYYQALISGGANPAGAQGAFNVNQQVLFGVNQSEIQSRIAAKQLQIESLNKQLQQTQVQLQATQNQVLMSQKQLETAQNQLETTTQQLQVAQGQFEQSKQGLTVNQDILNRLKPLAQEGGIPDLQLKMREQEVLRSNRDVLSTIGDIQRTNISIASGRNQVLSAQRDLVRNQSDLARLNSEEERIKVDMNRVSAELQNTIELSRKEILVKIADNQKQIAQIDSQLGQKKIENQKQIAQIDANLKKSEQSRQFQELRSPVDGVVFDLKATGPGFVARASEPIVKIIPQDGLEASVFITNKDIGFVEKGMKVEVDIESFPALEFGTIPGKLKSIGEDALPPTQDRPYYAFPATIELERQSLLIAGKEIPLQSGMSVSTRIVTRKRSVLSIFTDLFFAKSRSLETVR